MRSAVAMDGSRFKRAVTTALSAQAWVAMASRGVMPPAPSPGRIIATCRWAELLLDDDVSATSDHGALLAVAHGLEPAVAFEHDPSPAVHEFSPTGPWSFRGDDVRALSIGLGLAASRGGSGVVLVESGPRAILDGSLAALLLCARDRFLPLLVMIDHTIGDHKRTSPVAAPLASSVSVASEFACSGDEAAPPELIARLVEMVRENRRPALLELVGSESEVDTTAAQSAIEGAHRRAGATGSVRVVAAASEAVRKAALARMTAR